MAVPLSRTLARSPNRRKCTCIVDPNRWSQIGLPNHTEMNRRDVPHTPKSEYSKQEVKAGIAQLAAGNRPAGLAVAETSRKAVHVRRQCTFVAEVRPCRASSWLAVHLKKGDLQSSYSYSKLCISIPTRLNNWLRMLNAAWCTDPAWCLQFFPGVALLSSICACVCLSTQVTPAAADPSLSTLYTRL